MTLASRSSRLVGQLLDGLVGAAPFLLFWIVTRVSDTLGGLLLIVAIGWSVFYYFLADGLHDGQSLGKQWLGMRVIDSASGAPCTFGQSFIRNLLLALLGPIDWVFIFGERHQRLGDKAAGTIVISV
ncbi:MAG: RDD family protein [bacterium]